MVVLPLEISREEKEGVIGYSAEIPEQGTSFECYGIPNEESFDLYAKCCLFQGGVHRVYRFGNAQSREDANSRLKEFTKNLAYMLVCHFLNPSEKGIPTLLVVREGATPRQSRKKKATRKKK